jgi:hypothetical protein
MICQNPSLSDTFLLTFSASTQKVTFIGQFLLKKGKLSGKLK